MPIGSVQTVVVCVQSTSSNSMEQSVCPKVGKQSFAPVGFQAYMLDPSQQNNIEAAIGPFDYVYAGGLWAMAFSTVVGLYFVSSGIGAVLGLIRRG